MRPPSISTLDFWWYHLSLKMMSLLHLSGRQSLYKWLLLSLHRCSMYWDSSCLLYNLKFSTKYVAERCRMGSRNTQIPLNNSVGHLVGWCTWYSFMSFLRDTPLIRTPALFQIFARSLWRFELGLWISVVYLREVHESASISDPLVMSKARVILLKPLTMPRQKFCILSHGQTSRLQLSTSWHS